MIAKLYIPHPIDLQASLAQLAYVQQHLHGYLCTILGGRVAMDPS